MGRKYLQPSQRKNIPVFMNEDLFGILSEEEMIQEFPKYFGGRK